MTPPFSARRRADEFEALVSRAPTARPKHADQQTQATDQYADLLDLVGQLRALPPVEARPEFVGGLRERLMAEADTVLLERPATPPALVVPVRHRRRDRRVATVIGSLVAIGATSTVAVAAQGALPGESLYPIKRAIESAQLRMADDESTRGGRLLADAADRLTELEALAEGDARGRDLLIADTLTDFTEQAREGSTLLLEVYDETGERASAEQVREFSAESLDRLDAVHAKLPDSAQDELLTAGRAMTELDAAASTACPLCTGGVTETPEFLTLSLPSDLLSGIDADRAGLGEVIGGSTPVSGQDLSGIEVPDNLQVPENNAPQRPDGAKDPLTTAGEQAGETVKGAGETVKGTLKGTKDTVTGATGGLTTTLDDATGGAVGGLTGGLDDATGGLIGDLTGTLDGATGGLIGDATGGVLA
jgi:hypothetical protein